MVSYWGYDHSEGSPSEEGLQKDAKAIFNYAYKSDIINPHNIFLFGRSLGGAVAVYTVSIFQN